VYVEIVMSESLMSSSEPSEHTEAHPEMQGSWLTSLRAWFGQLIAGRNATETAAPTHKSPARQGYIITNKTAHRIAIKPDQQDSTLPTLIVAPFGSRELTSTEYHLYATSLEAWKLLDLVCMPPLDESGHVMRHSSSVGRMLVLLEGMLLVGAAVSWPGIVLWSPMPPISPLVLGGVGLALALFIVMLPQSADIRLQIEQTIGGLLVPITAFFVPALFTGIAIYELGPLTIHNYILAILFVLVLFSGVAAALPGALYFLFQRQRVSTLRHAFIQDIMRLCPLAQTTEDVEQLYGSMLDRMYGCDVRGRAPLSTYIPICVCTFLLSFGWCLVLLPSINLIAGMNQTLTDALRVLDITGNEPNSVRTALELVMVPSASAIGFGFLGTYFFALNFVFRRYVRADLGPKAYTHLSMRVLVGMILVWVVGQIPTLVNGADGVTAPWLVSAFFIGIFPEWALTIIREYVTRIFGQQPLPTLLDDLPLNKLRGITVYDRARLLEEGIENIENLAHHNIVELMIQTRIPTARLVDLVDQAILLLHLQQSPNLPVDRAGGDASAQDTRRSELDVLQGFGVRTASCLERAYKALKGCDPAAEDAFLWLLGGDQERRISRMGILLEAISYEEWMEYIRSWRDLRHFDNHPYSQETFYRHTAPKPSNICLALPPHDTGQNADTEATDNTLVIPAVATGSRAHA